MDAIVAHEWADGYEAGERGDAFDMLRSSSWRAGYAHGAAHRWVLHQDACPDCNPANREVIRGEVGKEAV